jgi:hypothetical protein
MIDIKELKDTDKGRIVVYKHNQLLNGKVEKGTITSWNDHYIFVDYYKTGKGTATRPENLTFDRDDQLIEDLEKQIKTEQI